MLKLEGLKLAPEEKEAALHRRAARLLRIPEEDVLSVQVLRRSIDAREELHLVYTVAAEVRQEKQVLRRCRDRRVSRFAPERYALPEVLSSPEVPPVVVGAGPGGLFAALVLARCGLRPILLERGRDTTARQRDVETFWRTGVLDPESNVQFGEGGAGAFSDGKLNTGTKDLRHRWILEELVRCGAPESILTDAKPHVGTDMLHIALQNLRQELLSLGAQVRFGHRLEGLESRDGVLTGLHVRAGEGTYRLPVRAVVLAPGHSARDTFQMLYEAGVPMEAKPFAVGVRIEHRQRDMDAAQYRQYAGHPCLPASTYKLSCHTAAGRGVFSFCVCPGGQVVAAASEPGRVVTNGMSHYARSGENINSQTYAIERAGMEAADRVIAVSNLTRNIIVTRYGIPAEKVVTVHNAVRFAEAECAAPERGVGDKIVTFLGRITYQKGPDYFVEAAAKVLKRVPNVRFVMAGSGDMMNHVIRRVARLGIADRFHFTGFLRGEDVHRMFQLSDVYVMPSVSEPFGISPLEAMRSNVPVIISKQSGVAEVLDYALKVDYWDVDALSDAIYALITYPALAKMFAEKGLDEVTGLKWDNAAAKIKAVYQAVIDEAAARQRE